MPELVVTLTEDIVQTAFARAEQIRQTPALGDSALYSVSDVVNAAFEEA